MKRIHAIVLTRAMNILGALLLFYGLRSINNSYERVYELAATGSSPFGMKIQDFPPTVLPYFFYILGAVAVWWLSDKIRDRHAT